MNRNTTFYDISGTNTFRLASRAWLKSVGFNGYGTNLQNIEKEARRIYVPDDGYILVQVDQSGAEALIVAYLCKDGNFRSLFLNNVKPHVFVAMHLFPDVWAEEMAKLDSGDIRYDHSVFINAEIPILKTLPFWKELDSLIKSSDNWEPSRRYYFIAKQVCHSSNYDVGVNAFRINTLEKSRGKISLSKQQASSYLDFYHGLFQEIREWHQELRFTVSQSGVLYNLFGFPREFNSELNYSDLKKMYAFIPQSTVGTITNIAYTRFQQFIEDENLDIDLLANTHDSYLCQCRIGFETECAKIMKSFIEPELTNFRKETFKMKSEAAAGFNWAPYKRDKNELGMRELMLN